MTWEDLSPASLLIKKGVACERCPERRLLTGQAVCTDRRKHPTESAGRPKAQKARYRGCD